MKRIYLMAPLLGALILAAGCASIPKVANPSGVDVAVRQLSLSQIRTDFGINAAGDYNPFIPFGGLITRQTNDYIVLQLEVRAAHKTKVTLYRVDATDEAGNRVAELYSWPRFDKLLQSWAGNGREYRQLRNRAVRAYIDPGTLDLGPGVYRYVAVLVGKHPMTLPVNIIAAVRVGSGQPRVFRLKVTKVD